MVSLYEVTIPVFIKNLQTLSKLLAKGSAHTAVPDEQLVESRLIADMGNMIFQIQRVSDVAKGLAVRVFKSESVELENTEKTMEDLQRRLTSTIKILEAVKAADSVGENDEVIFKAGTFEMKFTAKSYVNDFAIPNFYFHFVTAYALLRKEGVDVGKRDFLGGS